MAGFWAWMTAHWFLGFILVVIGISGAKEIVLAILAPWRRLGAPAASSTPEPKPGVESQEERPVRQEPEARRSSRFDRL